jgi:protein involved in polysaccharide export with SLBB domain
VSAAPRTPAMRTLPMPMARRTMIVLIAALAAGCASRSAPSPIATAPLAALAPPAPPALTPDYRIQAYDELHVRFTYQPEVSEQIPVRPDGRISLATTGEIVAVGHTPAELADLIREKSASRLRNPEVVVVVTKVAEQRVYVGGEVFRPGFVVLMPGMTPLQAVVQTGGFRPSAKLDSVLLLTPGEGGKFTAARMDMDQVVSDGVAERVRLHPGDVVYVPRTWIADMNIVVDQYVRGLIPALPHVGVGYSLSN